MGFADDPSFIQKAKSRLVQNKAAL